ncbi:MAG: hypothetical protein JSV29_01050 [Candidatus Bathyarchaeota archaeon]|nr:MAG: hypothetical protein JSV29_01050 [Candidatus Bathyarchaeota archaeon]
MSKKVKDVSKQKERRNRKQKGLTLWRMLDMLGVSQKETAYAIREENRGLDRGYFCKVINEDEDATLSWEKLRRLEDFVRENIIAIANEIFGMGFAPMEIISTGYGWSEPFASKEEELIEKNVTKSIASVLAGRPEPPALPNGVCATTVRIEAGRHCDIYVIVTKLDGKEARQAQIHEYDHLADYFRGKANKLRRRDELSELPNKGL